MRNCRATFSALVLLTFPEGTSIARQSPSMSFHPPPILSREQWGADELLGIMREAGEGTAQESSPPKITEETAPAEPSEREVKCREILQRYPQEFRHVKAVKETPKGERYLWPRQYSREVKLLVIHHTGENEHPEREEELTGAEHVRAIYRWHTVHNAWGDIGYHYLIDKEGTIYEGRAGGNGIVGAHTYCANTGTLGIALLGNFAREHPTEAQLQSLRWLLSDVSEEYGINPRGRTLFHGRIVPTIVAHRDVSLNKTICAGDVIEGLLPAIRRLIALRDFTSAMLPEKRKKEQRIVQQRSSLLPQGTTRLRLPPRGVMRLQLTYKAPKHRGAGERIAEIERPERDIGLWQTRDGEHVRLRNAIMTENGLVAGEVLQIHLTLLAPRAAGTYLLRIGDITYTLEVTGRRAKRP